MGGNGHRGAPPENPCFSCILRVVGLSPEPTGVHVVVGLALLADGFWETPYAMDGFGETPYLAAFVSSIVY